MSATFPFISPAVNLPTVPPRPGRRRRLLRQLRHPGRRGMAGQEPPMARPGDLRRPARASPRPGQPEGSPRDRRRAAGDLGQADARVPVRVQPARGSRSRRNSASSFRNDQDVQAVSDLFTEATGEDRAFFTTIALENSAQVALDWYLSRKEKAALLANIPTAPPLDREGQPASRGALRDRIQQETDPARRAEDLKLEERLKNYLRLEQLKVWWGRSAGTSTGATPPRGRPDSPWIGGWVRIKYRFSSPPDSPPPAPPSPGIDPHADRTDPPAMRSDTIKQGRRPRRPPQPAAGHRGRRGGLGQAVHRHLQQPRRHHPRPRPPPGGRQLRQGVRPGGGRRAVPVQHDRRRRRDRDGPQRDEVLAPVARADRRLRRDDDRGAPLRRR